MKSFFHALNIGTLAAWLSVVGFGTVGGLLPGWRPILRRDEPEKLTLLDVSPEVITREESLAPPPDAPAPTSTETLPAPPALPEIASESPLPDIPNLPSFSPVPQAVPGRLKTSTAPGNSRKTSGISAKQRFGAGHMPTADFPAYSRRNHQEGSVVVEFCVNPSGRVTAALAKYPCQWPLLNQTAIQTVMRWSFPPGGYDTFATRMTFKLN